MQDLVRISSIENAVKIQIIIPKPCKRIED